MGCAHGMNGWGWPAMVIVVVIVWMLIIAEALIALRHLGAARRTGAPPAGPSPQDLLAERFPHGKIDVMGYRARPVRLCGGAVATHG